MRIFILLLFISGTAAANDSTFRKRLAIDLALIVNRANSHTAMGRDYIIKKDHGYNTGCAAGFFLLIPVSSRVFFVPRLSLTYSEGTSLESRAYFHLASAAHTIRHKASLTVTRYMLHLNYEAGLRIKLTHRLYLQSSLLLNDNLVSRVNQHGILVIEEKKWSVTGSEKPDEITERETTVNRSFRSYRGSCLSARITAIYRVFQRRQVLDAIVFRNLGLDFDLPWWGAGCAVYFN